MKRNESKGQWHYRKFPCSFVMSWWCEECETLEWMSNLAQTKWSKSYLWAMIGDIQNHDAYAMHTEKWGKR